VFVEVL